MNEVLSIVVLSYIVGLACKAVKRVPNDAIPVVCAISGAILGAVGFFTMSDYPAADILTAIATGAFNGLAATGFDQAFKKLVVKE